MESDAFLFPGARDLNELKELKIKLPLRYHIKLHGLKLLRKRTISDSVTAALEEYFGRAAEAAGDAGAPEGPSP